MARPIKYRTPPASEGVRLLREIREPLAAIAANIGARSASTVSDYRTNKKSPDPDKREALAKEYGIPTAAWDDLAQDIEPAPTPEPNKLGATKAEVEAQLLAVKAALASADTAGSPATRARFTSEMRALLKLRSQIESAGVIDEDRLAQSEVFRRLVKRAVDALAEHPAARDRLIEVLRYG